jgi:formylglycine-generating enzyme required for sulfatase activity
MNCNPSQFNAEDRGHPTGRFPVEMVSWYDCLDFCNKLSARDGRPPYYSLTLERRDERHFIKWARVEVLGGVGYRLPTEAEWEYACRAGTQSATAFGNALSSTQANFNGLSPYGQAVRGPYLGRTSSVGCYPANSFHLHDMHGNVWEWCWDGFDEDYYRSSPKEDPKGPSDAANRVIRGGCWRDRGAGAPGGSGFCRSAARHHCSPVVRLGVLGFRVAVSPLR